MDKIKSLAVLLTVIFVYQPLCVTAQPMMENQASIKAQLEKLSIGKTVEVKLLRNDAGKIQGKLISIESDSFEIQRAQSGKVTLEKIPFSDVKSVKKRGMPLRYKILIGVGVYVVVATIVILATGIGD